MHLKSRVREGVTERSEYEGLQLPILLYHNDMGKIFMLLAMFSALSHRVAACSPYYFPSGLHEFTNPSDYVFEGDVTAVYIDGEQISTSVFDKAVQRLWKTKEILFKVKPIHMYVGEPQEQFEVWGAYIADGLCGRGLLGHADQKIWHVDGDDKKLKLSSKTGYLDARQEIEGYLDILKNLRAEHQDRRHASELIDREVSSLSALLNGEPITLSSAFYSTIKERGEMSDRLVKARSQFLAMDHAFVREHAQMLVTTVLND